MGLIFIVKKAYLLENMMKLKKIFGFLNYVMFFNNIRVKKTLNINYLSTSKVQLTKKQVNYYEFNVSQRTASRQAIQLDIPKVNDKI